MVWGSISLFGGFLENENSLETLNVIFENVFLTENEVFRNFSFDGEFSIFTDSQLQQHPCSKTLTSFLKSIALNKAAVSSATKQCALHIFASSDTDAPLLAPEHRFV